MRKFKISSRVLVTIVGGLGVMILSLKKMKG